MVVSGGAGGYRNQVSLLRSVADRQAARQGCRGDTGQATTTRLSAPGLVLGHASMFGWAGLGWAGNGTDRPSKTRRTGPAGAVVVHDVGFDDVCFSGVSIHLGWAELS
ncbi:hypothetical protein NW754_005324 [Fusarium falciforme]|nr:hypothetical protein NW754_005324 [Fusarium falciforme]KAJ4207365.1 hypothetical protein NW767_002614 [Fusarium falciforme]